MSHWEGLATGCTTLCNHCSREFTQVTHPWSARPDNQIQEINFVGPRLCPVEILLYLYIIYVPTIYIHPPPFPLPTLHTHTPLSASLTLHTHTHTHTHSPHPSLSMPHTHSPHPSLYTHIPLSTSLTLHIPLSTSLTLHTHPTLHIPHSTHTSHSPHPSLYTHPHYTQLNMVFLSSHMTKSHSPRRSPLASTKMLWHASSEECQ